MEDRAYHQYTCKVPVKYTEEISFDKGKIVGQANALLYLLPCLYLLEAPAQAIPYYSHTSSPVDPIKVFPNGASGTPVGVQSLP